MSVLPRLQAASASTDITALQSSLTDASQHAGVLPALDDEVYLAQAALASLELATPAVQPPSQSPPPPPVPLPHLKVGALALTLQEIVAATDNFAQVWLVVSVSLDCG